MVFQKGCLIKQKVVINIVKGSLVVDSKVVVLDLVEILLFIRISVIRKTNLESMKF